MSRILRRPMFRGGRVDSRGTGITSGLGYEKGGRVGYVTGGSIMSRGGLGGGRTTFRPPMVINTGTSTTAAPQGISYRGIFDALKSGGRGLLSRLAPFNPLSAAGVTMALPFAPSYFMAKANEPRTVEALEYMKSMNDSGVFDETAGPGDYEAFTKQIDILNKTGTPLEGSGVGLTTNQEDLSKLVEDIRIKKEEETNKNKETDTSMGTGTNEQSSDDLLDIDKEKFAKLLGADKARGEDISNMLLSFAGKALKDDATVKSAFSDFFEEESKRPSSKTKVDQAAAQLAINKYIKGEISRAELNKLLALNKAKTDLGDAAYISSALEKSTFINGVKQGLQRSRGGALEFVVTDSESMSEGNFKPGPEDIGKIFIEKDTKKVYEFNTNYQPVPIYSG